MFEIVSDVYDKGRLKGISDDLCCLMLIEFDLRIF